jgi:phage baseplate assembly protein V
MSVTDRLYRRILMTTAGLTISATNDKGPVHLVQGKVRGTPETIDNLQVVQLYGVASHAPTGSDALAIFGNGDRSNGVIVATANQKARPRNQQPGEVTIFTDEGDAISLQRGHVILITTQNITINAVTAVTITAPSVTITGPSGGKAVINVTGDIHATGTITADTISAPHGHVGP